MTGNQGSQALKNILDADAERARDSEDSEEKMKNPSCND